MGTAVAINLGNPLGKLVLLGTPQNITFFLATAWLLLLEKARPARGTAGPNLDAHFSSEGLDHSPYSPDFAPSDVYVFRQEAVPAIVSPAIKRQGS